MYFNFAFVDSSDTNKPTSRRQSATKRSTRSKGVAQGWSIAEGLVDKIASYATTESGPHYNDNILNSIWALFTLKKNNINNNK